ncbi:MAG: glycosyltransferase family 4 protein [Candidatus Methanoperedens sp.]|nr:glycosyltransferase family 4 protein [Candidatus Methanoperedens sp.]
MKIVFVSSLKITDVGGVLSHMKSLGEGLEKLGHTVDYITASSIPRPILVFGLYTPLIILKKFKTIKVIYQEISLIFMFLNIVILKQIFNRYDLICMTDYTVFIPNLVIKKIYKIPLISFIHSYMSHSIEIVGMQRDSLAGRFLIKEQQILLKHADLLIPVDSRIENNLISEWKINPDKIEKMINFVDIEEFKPRKSKQLFGLPNKKIVLCPRRVNDPKNGVIYAVKSMKYLNDDVLLVITGNKGEVVDNIKETMKKDGLEHRILFLPFIPHENMKYLYNEVEIVIIPSINYMGLEEATSISALEGMASGNIVIASNIGGLKEIIHDGMTGFLVPEKNPHKIAEIITQSLQSDTSEIVRNARKFVVKYCSNVKRAEELLNVCAKIK